MSTVRVAHLVSHPIQYFAPLYRELARRPELDLTVFFFSAASVHGYFDPKFGRHVQWDTPLLDGYSYRICGSAEEAPISDRIARRPAWDVLAAVARGGYDVVWAHSYSHPTTWIAFALAALARKGRVVRSEETLITERSAWRRALKDVPLRLLLTGARCAYIGEANRRYLEHYGVRPERLFAARYCVDNASLRHRKAELEPRREEIRARLGVGGGEPVVLYVGKIYPGKRVSLLLDAFAEVRAATPCRLLIVGDGPDRARLQQDAHDRGLPDVTFTGFLNQGELPEAYVAADVFALPSAGETWGLVVNEALNFELPVVVSDRVGCATDLVRHGWNGFIFALDDRAALAEALSTLVGDADRRAAFGARGRAIVDGYSLERCADGIVAACLAAAGRPERAAEAAA